MIRILTSVEIPTDNPKYLRSSYDDGSYKDYPIGKERTIIKDDKTYYLIEDENKEIEIKERLGTGNFFRCIFLIEVDFSGKIFNGNKDGKVDFSETVFRKNANFSKSSFDGIIDFSSATFIKNADFEMAEFTYSVKFNNALFSCSTSFLGGTFKGEAFFIKALFINEVNFIEVIFTKTIYLDCIQKCIFDFNFAKIDRLVIASKDIITINLKSTTVNKIDYGNTKFSADNRETFLTLKYVALKQHDQIKALEFHTQEYQSHYEKLNWNNADKWILGFENSISYFATNVGRAIGWLVFLIVFFYFFIFMLLGGGDANMHDFVRFTAPISYDLTTIFGNKITVGFFVGLLFILYKILQFVMIYEVVKSFRKFSRTL